MRRLISLLLGTPYVPRPEPRVRITAWGAVHDVPRRLTRADHLARILDGGAKC